MKKSLPKAIGKMQPIIVGGGWSGLAAAVRLAEAGLKPIVFEAAKQLGGRARTVKWQNIEIDNGQHLMIGAYHQMLDLIHRIGINETDVFQRKSLDLTIVDPVFPSLHLSATPYLPWPMAIIPRLYSSLGWHGFVGFLRLAKQVNSSKHTENITVEQWCFQTNQSPRLISQLWVPLCLAIMNTPIEKASASIFAVTLKESLASTRQAANLLIPKKPLGQLLPEPAKQFIEDQGGDIRLQTRIEKIVLSDGKVASVMTNQGEYITADNIIVAVSPHILHKLLGEQLPMPKVTDHPIMTLYLQYPAEFKLSNAMMGFSNILPQWIFDRSDQYPGLVAVVISGPGDHELLSKQHLIEQIVTDLKSVLPELPNDYLAAHVIREKRATFCCGVIENQLRPNCKTAIKGLWIAGDYAENSYPATLEGAVLNGYRAAEKILAR